ERLQALLRCPDLGLDPCLLIEQEVNISLPLGTFAHLLQPRTMAFYLVQQGLPLGVHAFVLLAESGEEVLALQPGHDGFGNRSIEVFFSHRDVKAAPPRYTVAEVRGVRGVGEFVAVLVLWLGQPVALPVLASPGVLLPDPAPR